MPPKVKFQREEIVNAALRVVREKGPDAITAREVAAALEVSPRPIFTWFDSMDELRGEVWNQAKELYHAYIERGLKEPIPFLGVWREYVRFAREEPKLYSLLFLSRPDGVIGGAADAMRFSQDLVRDSVMRVYNVDAPVADRYFRDLWLVAFSFATLIVTDDCPYPEEEILSIGAEISLSVLKAIKEVPGFSDGTYDRDAIFSKLVQK